MLRQLAGILILFTFLLVKGNLLFADRVMEKITITQGSQQDSDEPADDEKESKSIEFTDEFISHSFINLSPELSSEKVTYTDSDDIAIVHYPVWGPPPNCVIVFKA